MPALSSEAATKSSSCYLILLASSTGAVMHVSRVRRFAARGETASGDDGPFRFNNQSIFKQSLMVQIKGNFGGKAQILLRLSGPRCLPSPRLTVTDGRRHPVISNRAT
ncbi:MAG: hypothetical protein H6667_22115 [Ardenticatenaceae bacterium]|nr:hypothetical protein [Ardenticatenaceae bacterium]